MSVCFFNKDENKYFKFENMEELLKERKKLEEQGVELGNNEIVGLLKVHNYFTFKCYKEGGKTIKNGFQKFDDMKKAVDSFLIDIKKRDLNQYYSVGVSYTVGGDRFPYSIDLYNCKDNVEKVCDDYKKHKENGNLDRFYPLECQAVKVMEYVQEKQPLKTIIWDI